VLGFIYVMEEDVNKRMEPNAESLTANTSAEPAPPIHSRFLFVDVAALRAKQLRRGARVRIADTDVLHLPKKAERIAMEEVRRGLVSYDIPAPLPAVAPDEP
jgi:DNA-directed RNA polymerase subunit K/omega